MLSQFYVQLLVLPSGWQFCLQPQVRTKIGTGTEVSVPTAAEAAEGTGESSGMLIPSAAALFVALN